MAICPECETEIEDLDYAEKGEVITCPECGVDLEIVDTDPVELELVSELVDDDDDEEDDDLGEDDDDEDNRRWR